MRKKLSKILVTGGAGFIGSEFVRQAVKKGYGVIVVDKITYAGDLARLKEVKDRCTFYKTDICREAQLHSIFAKEKPDCVVHFAAESITEDTYIPIQSTPKIGTRIISFGDLWRRQSRNNKVQRSKNGEIIFLRGHQTKALSFLNGGQWMPIKAISRHWYKGKVIKLVQKRGIIKATPNHSIYASNLELTTPIKNPELLVIRKINEHNKKYKEVDKKLLAFLAAYITEGNTTFDKANGGYITEISQKNWEWLENMGRMGRLLFGLNYNIVKGNGAFHLQFSNKELFFYLRKNCGYYSDGKYFPDWIFDLLPNQREYFWKRLLEGDGSHDGRYTTTSYRLTNQVGLLLSLLHIDYRVYEREGKKYKRSWEFKTILDGQHYGLNQSKKIELNYEGWVYDLEIDKTHNFVCGIGNIVCHNTHVDRSIHDAAVFIETNIQGTQILLDLSRAYHIKKFIQISSDETYGEIKKGSFSEDSPLSPNSPYAASKASADFLIKAYVRTHDFPAVIVRPSNNYGPWQYPEKLIPVVILKALKDQKVPVYAKGENVREWLYVSDCASAVFLILQKGKPGEVYNVGSGQERRNIDTVRKILHILGKSENLIHYVKDRPGHDFRYSLDCSKIRGLGWRPRIDFREGIEDVVKWYRQHEDWLESKLKYLRTYWEKVYKDN